MANKSSIGNQGLSINFLPKLYQTTANRKFLQSTIDQLFQTGSVDKISGFLGRRNAKAAIGSDIFVQGLSRNRRNYQLESGAVIKDELNNVTFFKDYQDYINQLQVLGADVRNHARLDKQETYSWDPHIDWDKFTNFQNYYWLPYGPEPIVITGQTDVIESGYSVSVLGNGNSNEYIFTPDGLSPNPTLKLYRGQTYTFDINSPGNPFTIRTARSLLSADQYAIGITNNNITNGTVTLVLDKYSPGILYYQSAADINLGGTIQIFDIDQATHIDVDNDVLGKKTYTLANGVSLSNGMLVYFKGNVLPNKYATGQYYVEGVGSGIQLIAKTVLEVISPYTTSEAVLFDDTPFDSLPFSDATGYASQQDFITINRASRDYNPWSRYNRWFHKDVITASAQYNSSTPSLDQAARATRPIIEFEANLKLYNFGTDAGHDVDLIDNFTTDMFSIVEGSLGYNIDGEAVVAGQVILVTADLDPRVNNKLYMVEFVDVQHLNTGSKQIHLVELASPSLYQSVLIKQGKKNKSLMYWYNGIAWVLSQQKTNTNQAPLFDLFDNEQISYADINTYPGTTFRGTKVFSYKPGLGAKDKFLGFALSHQNVSNIGDIVFNFDLAQDIFQYKQATGFVTVQTGIGYLASKTYGNSQVLVNGWQTCAVSNTQAAVRIYKNSKRTKLFPLDIFDDVTRLSDLVTHVYINDNLLPASGYSITAGGVYYNIELKQAVSLTDIVTIKAFAQQAINVNGFYEVPLAIQNNPLNGVMTDFTLGEVSDHVKSIITNLNNFSGSYPGNNNMRDLGNITQYGTKFVQHSAPASLTMYHVTNQANNIIRALDQAQVDYNNFKREFVTVISNLGLDADVNTMFELAMTKITGIKPKTAPYNFSDMVPFGANTVTKLIVVDGRIRTYPLSNFFSLSTPSNKAVGIYHNGIQLVYQKEYTFNSQAFVVIDASVILSKGDEIKTIEYDSTDGCFVPETPAKLGMMPKYEPSIYLDTTLLTPQLMIQGHDGSQVLAYGDYRDALILELELRIYNNIKISYDATLFDISSIVPSYTRSLDYSRQEFDAVLAPSFYTWAKSVGVDFSKQISFDNANPFTYNYANNTAPDGSALPSYWRGVYRYLLNTDRPHLCPWEILGFTIQPAWWTLLYGPAPYTSDNQVMWKDISAGMVREPGMAAKQLSNYVRPWLINCVPVDQYGKLKSPSATNMVHGIITPNPALNFVFGDVGPVEASWRRSSYYPFALIKAAILTKPPATIGVLFDRARVVRNAAGQLVYKDTELRTTTSTLKFPSTSSSITRVITAGLVNYVVDLIFNYVFSNNQKSYSAYQYDISNITFQLSYRLGAYTNKDQFNLLLESKTPASSGNVFIPAENYQVFMNKSSPIQKLTYSGVIVTKLQDSYQVSGYSQSQPYFKYYAFAHSGPTINVGGISGSFSTWASNQMYTAGMTVRYNTSYYSVTVSHTSTDSFSANYFVALEGLPYTGGQTVYSRTSWDKTTAITVPYGTKFHSVQEVYDFIQGYGQWLTDQGFYFNEFNTNLGTVSNWDTSAKEFLFWTTQNWSVNQSRWQEWAADQPYTYSTVVKYNGEYYSANTNLAPSPIFDATHWIKLDGLSNIGSSIISLSPAAKILKFLAPQAVVDDINNLFNTYEIVRVDGTPIATDNLDSYRSGNVVSYSARGNNSIYGASFYFVQHEHVVIIDNNTIFNDVIYNLPSGYRRERIKVSGYVTVDWYGGLDIPGFVFDAAKVQNWQPWQDYHMGDIVYQQGFYYSANSFLPGTATFNLIDWTALAKPPTSQILPNWTNLATQFGDFYSLDVDSFDPKQQSMGQHLIGYQKRQYLANIIQDDVSEFKFFQGMIREKGTQNVLNKLFGVLSNDNLESLSFYEEWAIRVGQYGAANAFEQIEFVLDESKFRSNPQAIYLTNQVNSTINPFIIQQTPADVYVKPMGYISAPWPLLDAPRPLLRSAGYVNSSDVFVSVKYLSDLAKYDVATFNNGCYIWCTFDQINDWNVYRFTDIGLRVSSVSFDTTSMILTLQSQNIISGISVGSWIGIGQTTSVNGFYQVISVVLNAIKVQTALTSIPDPFMELAKMVVYALVSQRATSIDTIDTLLPTRLIDGELIWTDDNGTGTWGVWKYQPAYSNTVIKINDSETQLNNGRVMAMARSGKISVSGSSDGKITVFAKPGPSLPWIKSQLIQMPDISGYTSPSITQPYGATGAIASLNSATLKTSTKPSSLIGGTGYLPSGSSQIYRSVPLIAPVGRTVTGSGAIADVTITNGSVTNVTIIQVALQYGPDEYLTADARYIGSRVLTAFSIQVSDTCGSGYTPLLGVAVYKNVALIGGSGTGATADISVQNGKVISAVIHTPGFNYSVADQLTVNASSVGGTGTGFTVGVLQTNPNNPANLSTVLALSDDATWLAVGHPLASYVSSQLGSAVPPGVFDAKAICFVNNQYYQTAVALQSQYIGVRGITTSLAAGALFTIQSITPGTFNVIIVNSGTRYNIGQKVIILGSLIGGLDILNDITITVQTVDSGGAVTTVAATIANSFYRDRNNNSILVPSRTYTSVSGSLQLGTGATFTVIPQLVGYTVTATAVGTNYYAGDTVQISGTLVGGLDIVNDVVVSFDGTIFSLISGKSTWIKIPYVPVDVRGQNSNMTTMGAVSLYQKDIFDNYNLIDTVLSPAAGSLTAVAHEQFGSNLTFVGNTLLIGSKGFYKNIYTMRYQDNVQATVYYNAVGSLGSTISVSSTAGIRTGMYVKNTGFSNGQYVTKIVDKNTLKLSAGPDKTPSGALIFYTSSWSYDYNITLNLTEFAIGIPAAASMWYALQISDLLTIAASADGTTLAISGVKSGKGQVWIYKNAGLVFLLQDPASSTLAPATATEHFGQDISFGNSSEYLAISDDFANTAIYPGADNYQGIVTVYRLQNTANTSNYLLYQSIYNHNPEAEQLFGNRIGFMNDTNTLVIYSKNGSTQKTTSFDQQTGVTTFDKQSTNFIITTFASGRVDVYDSYATKWVYAESLVNTDQSTDSYGAGFAVSANEIMVGAPYYNINSLSTGQVWSYSKAVNTYTWSLHDQPIKQPDVSKIKKAFLYDRKKGAMLAHLDIIDANQGKIPGPAEAEIRYKCFLDPAVYAAGTASVTIDASSQWSNLQVGQLWWNLATCKFVNSFVQDPVSRTNTWNMLATGATVDIYEWVKSKYKPSAWDQLADTVAGLAQGISGTSLYGDTAYSVTSFVDNVSKKVIYTYYYWVNNKAVIPQVTGRNMSASDVSKLIANPRGQDYAYLALTGPNTFSLINVQNYLKENNTVLSVEYWTTVDTSQNIHSQWKIVSNDPKTILPKTIEQKWFDSLCGVDTVGRSVPDFALPPKLLYGIENRPRQTMFINRFEALKEFIESVNAVLLDQQVVYNSNLLPLEATDPTPTVASGLWDSNVATDSELVYLNLIDFKLAQVAPLIQDGRIVGITVLTPGKGYLQAPYIQIIGAGIGASVRAIINSNGAVTGATILQSGQGYTASTVCLIRTYCVLTSSDSQASGNWSIYSYDVDTKLFSRILTQSYDVTKYWKYHDWYGSAIDSVSGTLLYTANQFSAPDITVANYSDLGLLTQVKAAAQGGLSTIGLLIKVSNGHGTNWVLLYKYSDSQSIDWTQSYQVVGIQNGTIQFSRLLYEFQATNVGYDNITFDGGSFDTVAGTELRIILNTIKNNLLTGTDALRQYYLDLFFNSVRYSMREQIYIDWAYKTSFVKAENHIGTLNQPINYPVDNIGNFEDFIAEVKPYRTKLRQYVNNYTNLDVSQSAATDFDLAPVYKGNGIGVIYARVDNDELFVGDATVQTYPWKFWLDNVGFSVIDIRIVSGGSGYIKEPNVVITSGSGQGAVARAFITNGQVVSIILMNANKYGESGSGYLSTPKVKLDGGLGFNGVQAQAVAIIGNSRTRSHTSKIKFDRLSKYNYITQLAQTQSFSLASTSSQLQFNLTWPPQLQIDPKTTLTQVLVNGIPVLREFYKLSVVTKTTPYHQYSGMITFATGHAPSGLLQVNYKINIDFLNSSDRNSYLYQPTVGMLPNAANQLMLGIDYGGVMVDGTGFNTSQGWDALPFYSDKWSNSESSYDDYRVTVSAGQYNYPIPNVPWPATWQTGDAITAYRQAYAANNYLSDGVTVNYAWNIFARPVKPKIKTITYSTDVRTNFILSGSYGNVLKVVNTSNILPGMSVYAVSGTGWVLQHLVIEVVDTTTLTLSDAPDSVPPDGELLTFTLNRTGSKYLSLNSVSGIKVGDMITTTTTNSIVVNTRVVAVNPIISKLTTNNVIEMDDMLYSDIPTADGLSCLSAVTDGTTTIITLSLPSTVAMDSYITVAGFVPSYFNGVYQVTVSTSNTIQYVNYVTDIVPINGASTQAGTVKVNNLFFGRDLITPTDVTIYGSGSAILTLPLPRGTLLEIVGRIDDVRLDDPNYGDTWTVTGTVSSNNSLVTLEPITFPVGNTVIFTGLPFGNVLVDTPYTVLSIIDSYHFTVYLPTVSKNIIEQMDATATVIANSYINAYAIIKTPVYTNSTFTLTLPQGGQSGFSIFGKYGNFIGPFNIIDGDLLIFRRSSSDGSVTTTNLDFDTSLSGGDFTNNLGAYSSAKGIAADEIVVDGDGFVTTTTSPAPEEVVPGQVVDALAIKVYDRPTKGSSAMRVDNFVCDGVNNAFVLAQQPNSSQAIIVKVGNTIATSATGYVFDYRTRTVTLTAIPQAGVVVTVFNIGVNGANVLDQDYFVGDSVTKEFVTKAPWLNSVSSVIYADGVVANPVLFKTDSTYQNSNVVGLRFADAPVYGALISYIIVSGGAQTFSVTHAERLAVNGITDTYALTYPVGTTLPYESNMIVRVDNQIYNSNIVQYFTIVSGLYSYSFDVERVKPYSAGVNDIAVIVDGSALTLGRDYSLDLAGITVVISPATNTLYQGKLMAVSSAAGSQYTYNKESNSIQFNSGSVPAAGSTVEVITSYDHQYLDLERTLITVSSNITTQVGTTQYFDYNAVGGGFIRLDRTVVNGDYVWITRNNSLLTPNVDYVLYDDHVTVKLASYPADGDRLGIVTFGNNVLTGGISYMQFKDMLNRVTYKRLNKLKQTILTKDLHYADTSIYLQDASNLDTPIVSNLIPGVVDIRGERIEYFVKSGNTLSQLRRGTLGTGIYNINKAGTSVQGIGASETMPYQDSVTKQQIVSDGVSQIIPLNILPVKSSTKWNYGTDFVTSIPSVYGQCDNIEVFVGGYDDAAVWASKSVYAEGTVVNVGSYTYRCLHSHTSGDTFFGDVTTVIINANGTTANILSNVASSTVWTFFVGNIRLSKRPYKVHNVNVAPYSPLGDQQLDADFAVDGVSQALRLTTPLKLGTTITVIQRSLVPWDGLPNLITSNVLLNGTDKISQFLKSQPGTWYSAYNQISTVTVAPAPGANTTGAATFDGLSASTDNDDLTMDQG